MQKSTNTFIGSIIYFAEKGFWNYREKYILRKGTDTFEIIGRNIFSRKGTITFEIIRRNIFAGKAQILLKLSGEIFLQERQYWEDASPLHFRLLQMCRCEKRDILTSQTILSKQILCPKLKFVPKKWFGMNISSASHYIEMHRCIHTVLDIPLRCPNKWISLPGNRQI